MKTIIQTLTGIFILVLFFQSCNTENFELPAPDPEYPTVITRLSENKRYEKLVLLDEIKGSDDHVIMDEYGFVTLTFENSDTGFVNLSEIKEKVFRKIKRYHTFFGLHDLIFSEFEDIFYYIMPMFGGNNLTKDEELINFYINEYEGNDSDVIRFQLTQSNYLGYNVESSIMYICYYIDQDKIVINGFFVPEIYIPENDAVSISDAINIALNDFIDYSSAETEKFDIEILKKSRKVIIKRVVDGDYIFNLSWKLNLYPNNLIYYIDSQTGEILRKIDYAGHV